MVHLTAIPGPVEKRVEEERANRDGGGGEGEGEEGNGWTQSVYGSRFACEELPRHEMPEREMPRDVAYRLIKDELSLDNNPKLNLASFVTTFMEEEAEKLMSEAFSKNFIDYEEYPQCADIQNRCVNMIGALFHATPGQAVGTSTVGSSEAIMLSVLAMKKRWAARRREQGKACDRPNLVMSAAVQVCWEKAVRYFDVEPRLVYCEPGRYVLDPAEAAALCDEDTIGVCAIVGTTYTGEYEDVQGVSDALDARGFAPGELPIHVDAASGGFVAPFVAPQLAWDFRCARVVSINVSGHKYGLVYPGVGWAVWRSSEFLPRELVFNINYLGADQASFTLNFSKGASQVVGQYYQLIRLGRRGYRSIMMNLTHTADYLADALEAQGFVIMSERAGRGLPLVAFHLPREEPQPRKDGEEGEGKEKEEEEGRTYDEFALARVLRARGWVVPAYTMAPRTNNLKMLRVVVREDFSRTKCDLLIGDIKIATDQLRDMDRRSVERQNEYIQRHILSAGKARQEGDDAYKNETHSLQGQTGKTNGVC